MKAFLTLLALLALLALTTGCASTVATRYTKAAEIVCRTSPDPDCVAKTVRAAVGGRR